METPTASRLPTGTVTFLFTDIEGSTRLLESTGERYAEILEAHLAVLRDALAAGDGVEVSTEGDALFAVFASAIGAAVAATGAQRGLAALAADRRIDLSVRMGLHTGEARRGGDNYVGMDIHRAARIAAAGHGGQVLVSDATRTLIEADLPNGVSLRDLGAHRLKDLPAPVRLWQLDIDGLPNEFPALRSLDARPGNLPVRLTELVGREQELAAAAQLLDSTRLLVLTGPGGAGKTRLGIALANRLLDEFADGAFFVALEDAHERGAVLTAIATAMRARERPDRDLESVVRDFVSGRELLLVLDNFEQVVAAAPVVSELLAVAPRLKVVVTSRAVLNLEGEQDYEVPPLGLPDPDNLPVDGDLSQYDAVALFIARAVAVKPGFQVTNANAPAVAEICSRLDGLPLAIELAAARVRLLDPAAILARLRDHLRGLAEGPRDGPARQRTLERTVDWSFDLLPDAERAFFVRLGVFSGGWDIAAAETVAAPAELGVDALDGLAALADHSLIQAVHDDADEARFRMLQVIREFALGRLELDPEVEAVRRRHAFHVLAMVEAAEPELVRTEIRRHQLRLRLDEENIRVALRWAIEREEAEVGLRIAGSLWQFWHYWAHLREGRSWLEAVLALPDPAGADAARAKALSSLASIDYWQGDGVRAGERYEEALAIYRRLDDRQGIADTVAASGWAAIARGDPMRTVERWTQARELYRELGDEVGAANCGSWLGAAPVILGISDDVDRALAATDAAIETARRLGRLHDAADGLGQRAFILRRADRPDALDTTREAVVAWSEIGNLGRLGFFRLVARLELQAGHAERAVVLGSAADRHRELVGGELSEAMTQVGDTLGDARPLLAPEEFDAAVDRGRQMTVEQVIAYVIETDRPS